MKSSSKNGDINIETMSVKAFGQIRYLPKLRWIPELMTRNKKVPPKVAEELSALSNMDKAQEFVESAGLEVLTNLRRDLDIVYLIPINSPECLTGYSSSNLDYFAPQVSLPKIECREIPFGTLSANFILPSICSSEAKKVLQEYQEIFITLSERLQAAPFAYITGYKTEVPLHELDMLGFRFFFSSEPDKVYRRISKILKTLDNLRMKNGITPEQLAQDFLEFTSFKFRGLPREHPLYSQKKAHPMLGDLQFNYGTKLVDLRTDN